MPYIINNILKYQFVIGMDTDVSSYVSNGINIYSNKNTIKYKLFNTYIIFSQEKTMFIDISRKDNAIYCAIYDANKEHYIEQQLLITDKNKFNNIFCEHNRLSIDLNRVYTFVGDMLLIPNINKIRLYLSSFGLTIRDMINPIPSSYCDFIYDAFYYYNIGFNICYKIADDYIFIYDKNVPSELICISGATIYNINHQKIHKYNFTLEKDDIDNSNIYNPHYMCDRNKKLLDKCRESVPEVADAPYILEYGSYYLKDIKACNDEGNIASVINPHDQYTNKNQWIPFLKEKVYND